MNQLHTFLAAGNVQARPVLGDLFDFGTQTGLTGFPASADEKAAFELGGTLDEMDRILVVARDQFNPDNLPKVDDVLTYGGAVLQVRAIREDASAFVLGLKMISAQPDRSPVRPYVDMSKATRAFNLGVNFMSRLTGVDRRKIVRAEAGSVLKGCAADTKVAALEEVERGAILRAFRGAGLTGRDSGEPVTVNSGYKKSAPYGRVFLAKKGGNSYGFRRTHDANFAPINQHYSNSDWSELRFAIKRAQELHARASGRAPESVALARGSWVLLADTLGIKLENVPGGRLGVRAIAQARAARAYRGLQVRNAASVTVDRPGLFSVTMINRYPGGEALGFQRKLAARISGRALFMAKALQKGFDASAAQTARLFPGWVAKPGSN